MTIQVPALMIAVNKHRLTKPLASEFMNELMPNAELITVAPANHQSLIEWHQEENESAKRFFKNLG